MGCTSSAPNVPEIAANTADKESTTENEKTIDAGDVKEESAVREAFVKKDSMDEPVSKELPTCDNLEENIKLASNSNSFTNIINEEPESDNQQHSVVNNEEIEPKDQHDENRFSTLKAVADQVLLNNIFEDIEQNTTPHQETSDSDTKEDNTTSKIEEKSTELIEECSTEETENKKEQEITEESSSPSQSDGNRSTRWEALADIAAELPPSLAVDPVTGQIYTLTK